MKRILTFVMIGFLCLSIFAMLRPTLRAAGQPPVGYWKLDEGSGITASDSSGNGNTGTLHGGATWTDGKFAKAIDFNGVDGYVQIPQSSSLDVTAQVTVEAWVYLRAYVDSTGMVSHLVSRSNSMGGPLYVLATFANGKINYDTGPFTGYHSSVATLALNSWTHLAMTYNGASVCLYINGVPDSSYAQSGSIPTTSYWLAIGCKPTGTHGGPGAYAYTNGIIDDVRIYNRALTQQEIQTDMNNGSQGDLWIEDIQPVQTLVNCSTLILGKPTVFNMTIINTYPDDKKNIYLQIKCGSLSPWYEGPIENIPKNGKIPFCTGGKYSGVSYVDHCYHPSGEFDVTITIDAFGPNAHTSPPKHIGPTTGYQFKDLGKLKILYVPVGFWGGSTAWLFGDPQISDINVQNEHKFSDSFVKAIFPVDPRFFTSAVGQKVELNTPASIIPGLRQYYAWIEFLRENAELKLWEQPKMGGYYRIVAVVPQGQSPSWLGYWLGTNARGMTYFDTYDSVCWTEEGYWATPAHELWHSYTHVSDSAPVDPWHCSKEGGGYWDQQHACLMYTAQPLMRPCMMLGGDNYQQSLFNDGRTMDLYQWICQDCYAKLTSLTGFQICSDPEVLFTSGLVFENDSVSLQPFYRLSDGYADLAPGSVGNYSLRFLDANLQVIAIYGFNMTFYDSLNVTAFSHAVEYPAGASIVQLLHGDTVIASRGISANPPLVNMTYPSSGETLTSGQNATIQWQASDADNDPLSYTVLYTPDNGSSWIPIQTDVTETSLNWTVPNDHPTDQCRIKVVATDGVNTGENSSDAMFTILRHDVAVDDIATSKNIVCEGYALPINVTVENQGNYTETFNVTAYANTNITASENVTLSAGSSTILTFTWNTTGWPVYNNYTIWAYAWPVEGEISTGDNALAGGTIMVSHVGDITGDGKVDIQDLARVSAAYGSLLVTDPLDPRYGQYLHPATCPTCPHTPNADITNDGKVDIQDLARTSANFGWYE